MAFEDKNLTCRDCNQGFAFTAGEQEFYQSRGLRNEPSRCPTCRASRRQQRNVGGGGGQGERQMFAAVCASCGADTQVPFEPRQERPVYCTACYSKVRDSGR
ncbi:MAG: zinc-ribbon domain containing protein [Dehalococcoidia bacterium]|nr:zinc-ribbon domain containing protein [Dehalococcoidia bacterium]